MIGIPKPTKAERPGIQRRNQIEREWPWIRDERKKELYRDGYWICFYCRKPIWKWDECVMAHVVPKGREPSMKLNRDFLVPSHAECNDTRSEHYKTYTIPSAKVAIAEYLESL